MKKFRTLLVTMTLLAFAGSSQAWSPRNLAQNAMRFSSQQTPKDECPAKSIHFFGFAFNPFAGIDLKMTPNISVSEEEWQNEVVTEGLKTWQLLCKKGRLDEAEQLASMLSSLQPDNPKVRAACTATNVFKHIAGRMASDAGQGMDWMPTSLPVHRILDQVTSQQRPTYWSRGDLKSFTLNDTCQGGACSVAAVGGSSCPSSFGLAQSNVASNEKCCADEACAKGCCEKATAIAGKSCCEAGKGCCCSKETTRTTLSECPIFKGNRPIIIMLGNHGMPGMMPTSEMHSWMPQQVMLPPPPMPMNMAQFVMPNPVAQSGQFQRPILMPEAEEALRYQPAARTVVSEEIAVHQQVAAQAQHCHLVTAYLEAHCERMSSAGTTDCLILEGNVRLTCKKGGQPIRIEAQRVQVNIKECTFTVETAGRDSISQRPAPANVEQIQNVPVLPVPLNPDADRPRY